MNRPNLVVVIGANGAGKTTWGTHHRNRLPVPFYNADVIAEGLGDANSAELQARARALVDEEVAERLRLREPFGFESTWSGQSRPSIVRRATEQGYETHAIFLGTAHHALNIARVRQRVLEGGHHVPQNEIVRRWTAAFENLLAMWECSTASMCSIARRTPSGSSPKRTTQGRIPSGGNCPCGRNESGARLAPDPGEGTATTPVTHPRLRSRLPPAHPSLQGALREGA